VANPSKMARIHAGETEIHGGLFAGFIHRQQETFGDGFIVSLEALELFGGVVKGVIDAFAAEEQAVTVFHGS